MRLLKVQGEKPEIVELGDNDAKGRYAILSHRWLADEEEVTYEDVKNHRNLHKKGWLKISACRAQAVKDKAEFDGLEYVWIDTCCIDKRSSQELTEAINAMFSWYRDAAVCYAYLADVEDVQTDMQIQSNGGGDLDDPTLAVPEPAHLRNGGILEVAVDVSGSWSVGSLAISQLLQQHGLAVGNDHQPLAQQYMRTATGIGNLRQFAKSEWFTRAWTLQEMLAPTELRFYSQTWSPIARLGDMIDIVAAITDVHRAALAKQKAFNRYSIAQRFSWAARRRAKKVEDRAYSLLGIFGVNIPIIYGEGAKAFMRLQEELLRVFNDDSIFAFGLDAPDLPNIPAMSASPSPCGFTFGSILAASPEAFRGSRDICKISLDVASNYQLINQELRFMMPISNDERWTQRIKEPTKQRSRWQRLRDRALRGSFDDRWTPRMKEPTKQRSRWQKLQDRALRGSFPGALPWKLLMLDCSPFGDPTKGVALRLQTLSRGRHAVRSDSRGAHCDIIDLSDAKEVGRAWRRLSTIVVRERNSPDNADSKPLELITFRALDGILVQPQAQVVQENCSLLPLSRYKAFLEVHGDVFLFQLQLTAAGTPAGTLQVWQNEPRLRYIPIAMIQHLNPLQTTTSATALITNNLKASFVPESLLRILEHNPLQGPRYSYRCVDGRMLCAKIRQLESGSGRAAVPIIELSWIRWYEIMSLRHRILFCACTIPAALDLSPLPMNDFDLFIILWTLYIFAILPVLITFLGHAAMCLARRFKASWL